MTQKEILRKAFSSGKVLTARQIQSMYGIASPSKVISRLRDEDGMNIRTAMYVNSKGNVTFKYALQGVPKMATASTSRTASKRVV